MFPTKLILVFLCTVVEQSDARVRDAEYLLHVDRAENSELSEKFRRDIDVRAGVYHKHRLLHREYRRDRRALDSLDASDEQSRAGHKRAGVASGDESVPAARGESFESDAHRRVLL